MKRILAIFCTVVILWVIYSRINLKDFALHLAELRYGMFALAIAMFIPQVAITAYRWKVLIENQCELSFWESCRLVLASNALNLVLPSRLGDLGKGVVLVRQNRIGLHRGVNVVIYEKLLDVGGLAAVLLIGSLMNELWNPVTQGACLLSVGYLVGMFLVFLIPVERLDQNSLAWMEGKFLIQGLRHFILDLALFKGEGLKNRKRHLWIIGITLFTWWVHVAQVHLFFLAMRSVAPAKAIYQLVPSAIFIGLIPISFLGIGVRDSALIYLFAPYESAAVMAGVGLLTSLRYIIPGLLGLLFLNQYLLRQVELKPSETS